MLQTTTATTKTSTAPSSELKAQVSFKAIKMDLHFSASFLTDL
jgi:hypothetical protein